MSSFKAFLDGQAWSTQAGDEWLSNPSILSQALAENRGRALRLLGDPDRVRTLADAGLRDWKSAVRPPIEEELRRQESEGGEARSLAGRRRFLLEAFLARQPKAAIGPLLSESEYVSCVESLRTGRWPDDLLKGLPPSRILQQALRPDLYVQGEESRRSSAGLILSGLVQVRGGAAVGVAVRIRLALVGARGSNIAVDGPFGKIKEAAEAIGRGLVEQGSPFLFQPLDPNPEALATLQRPDLERYLTFYGLPSSIEQIATLLAIENRIVRNELHDPWIRRHAVLAASDHPAAMSARSHWEAGATPTRSQAIQELLIGRCIDATELKSLLIEDLGDGSRTLSADFFFALLEDRRRDESEAAGRRALFGLEPWFSHHVRHFAARPALETFSSHPLPDSFLRSPATVQTLNAHPLFEPFAKRIEEENHRRALNEMRQQAERAGRGWLFGYVEGLRANRDRGLPKGLGESTLARLVESCGRLEPRWWAIDLTEADELWIAERAKASGQKCDERIVEIVRAIESRIRKSLHQAVRVRGERELNRCMAVVLGAGESDRPPPKLLSAFRTANEAEFIRLVEGEDTELPVPRPHPRVFDQWWLLAACLVAVCVLPAWVLWRNRPGGAPPAPPVPKAFTTAGEFDPVLQGWGPSGNGWRRELDRSEVLKHGAFAEFGDDLAIRKALTTSPGGDPSGQDGQDPSLAAQEAFRKRVLDDLASRFPIGMPLPQVPNRKEAEPARAWTGWKLSLESPTDPKAIVTLNLKPLAP
jgi:hypothetical protein